MLRDPAMATSPKSAEDKAQFIRNELAEKVNAKYADAKQNPVKLQPTNEKNHFRHPYAAHACTMTWSSQSQSYLTEFTKSAKIIYLGRALRNSKSLFYG